MTDSIPKSITSVTSSNVKTVDTNTNLNTASSTATLQMKPTYTRFKVNLVREIINSVLNDVLVGKSYHANNIYSNK